ncbi:MAG: signal peptidase I [Ruminococcaceae bacterium]|nr:signal peptidase I [Oscillospiraceae bacterium]
MFNDNIDNDIDNVEIDVSDIQSKRETTSFKAFVFDWLEVLVHAIIAVVICFSFLFRIATIDGPSMKDTLYDGERVIISNLFYEPKVGDIVVISRNKENSVYTMNDSNTPIIKRIIAMEGQTVDIDFEKGVVYVDGIELDEPYARTPTNRKYDVEFPVTVDEGCVFVLGDNRNDSMDSRDSRIGEYGMVDTRYILGHAVFRILPFDKIGRLD